MQTFLMLLKLFWLKIVLGIIVLVTVIWAFRSYSGSGATVVEPKGVADTAGKDTAPSPVPVASAKTATTQGETLSQSEKKVVDDTVKTILMDKGKDIAALSSFLAEAVLADRINAKVADFRREDFEKLAGIKDERVKDLEHLNEETREMYKEVFNLAVQARREVRDQEVRDRAFLPHGQPTGSNPCAGLSPRQRRICEENRRAQELYRN